MFDLKRIRTTHPLFLQLSVVISITVILTVLLTNYFNYSNYKKHYLPTEHAKFISEIKEPTIQIKNQLINFGELTELISVDPLVKKYIALINSTNQIKKIITKDKLQNFFDNALKLDKKIEQLVLYDSESGKELAKASRLTIDGKFHFSTSGENPRTIKEQLFRKAIELKKGQMYFSQFMHFKATDNASGNNVMIINALTPVFIGGTKKAIVNISFSTTSLIEKIENDLPENYAFFLFDNNKTLIEDINHLLSKDSLTKLVKMKLGVDANLVQLNKKYVMHSERIFLPSVNMNQIYVAGVASRKSIDPIFEISTSPESTLFIVLGSLVLTFSWWLYSSYYSLQRQMAHQKSILRVRETHLSTILKTALDSIVVLNRNGIIERVNDATEGLFGYKQKELIGNSISMLIPEQFSEDCESHLKSLCTSSSQNIIGLTGPEILGLKKDGSRFPLELGISMMNIDGEVKFTGIIRDIFDLKAYQKKIEHQAYYDSLTGLPNRQFIKDRLEQELASAKRHNNIGAILFIDLDRYKIVNDVYGHKVGDELLVQVASRLRNLNRIEDTVGRLGGDEFLVILSSLSHYQEAATENAMIVARKIQQKLSEVYIIDDKYCSIGASIGVYLFPDDTTSVDSLIQQADFAMYNAKEAGRNTVVLFDSKVRSRLELKYHLENKLKNAIEKNEFFVKFQPVFNKNKQVIGAESLLRWRMNDGSIHYPKEFLSVAESSSSIGSLGNIVISKSFEALHKWVDYHNLPEDFRLSINLSPKQFLHEELIDQLQINLNKYRVNPNNITFEFTEDFALHSEKELLEKLKQTRLMGFKFSIDDFGTGYSSLTYVRNLPLSELKIDKSIVGLLLQSEKEISVAQIILDLAKKLNLSVIAEGVEKEQQFILLKEMGCDYFQGYFLGGPVSFDKFEEYFKDSEKLKNNVVTANLSNNTI